MGWVVSSSPRTAAIVRTGEVVVTTNERSNAQFTRGGGGGEVRHHKYLWQGIGAQQHISGLNGDGEQVVINK